MTSNHSISYELKTDDEIQRLKQPLTRLDLMALRQQILRFGCSDPITVWEGVIIDGVHRYDICKRNNIAFTTINAPIRSKEEAFVYVCKKQLLRDDLIYEMRKYLVGRLYRAEVSLKASSSLNSNRIREQYVMGTVSRKQDIVQDVSAYLGLSVGTVLKYGIFSKCVDNIRKNDPSLAKAILNGRIKISHENIMKLDKFSSWELKQLRNKISPNGISHIRSCDIDSILENRPNTSSLSAIKSKPLHDSELPIRKVPKYDPDSELSNLILTVPTWINSIIRSQKNTDFGRITPHARERTLMQLNRLKLAITSIEKDLGKDQ